MQVFERTKRVLMKKFWSPREPRAKEGLLITPSSVRPFAS